MHRITEGKIGGDASVACSLEPGDLPARLRAWRVLREEALTGLRTERGHLTAIYGGGATTARRLEELTRAEGECCPFLEFGIHGRGETVTLDLRYPPEAEAVVALVVPELAGAE